MPPEERIETKLSTDEHETSVIPPSKAPPKQDIVWVNVAFMLGLHLAAVYGIYLLPQLKVLTWFWIVFMHHVGGIGITAGAHRLWSHRSYKATAPMRLLLMIMNSAAGQNHIFEWVRDHRVHHKYAETDADPHNAQRGFFFSHCGWLFVRKHPDVISKGKQLPLDDLYADKIVMFQKRNFKLLTLIFNAIVPTVLPYFLWDESVWRSYFTSFALRYVFTLNMTWCVNSVAHLWGDRPYDKSINPAQNVAVAMGTGGEGYHNYHHTFPQDYATAELGERWNLTKWWLDFFAVFGMVYDRKTISHDAIIQRRKKTGDLQHLHESQD